MNEEKLKRILGKLAEVKEEIKSIPGHSGSGQLIDAVSHAKSMEEHLKRYYAMLGGKL